MEKQTVVHTDNRIRSNNGEQTIDTHNSVNESQMRYDSWKRPDVEDYMLHISIDLIFWKRQNYSDTEQISCQGFQGEGGVGKEQLKVTLGMTELFCILTVVKITRLSVITKSHETITKKSEFYFL